MRRFLPVFAGALVAVSASAGASSAADRCTGDACAAVTVSDDGCTWTNAGKKSIRFSLIAKDEARMATVLAPGETFKETDKAFCLAAGKSDPRIDARFATLAEMPPEPVAAKSAPPAPRSKPAVSVAQVETAIPAVVTQQATALPREKPEPPPTVPMPRPKPEAPEVAVAAAPPVAPVAPSAPAAAVASVASLAPAACGDACPPVLFKSFDDCLWVLNFNPRPVAFQAIAGGRKLALSLEAADGEKADAKTQDAKGVHMRFSDPFQSAGSGIPFFRARLGAPGACVKDRKDISAFVANYAN